MPAIEAQDERVPGRPGAGAEQIGDAAVGWRARMARWRRREEPAPVTAFVLAGGGSRGAVQVGMLGELVDRGIKADRVFGASVGAVNGAAYCGDPTPEGMERLAEIWRELTGDVVFPRGRVHGPWRFFQQRPAVAHQLGLRADHRRGHRLRAPRGCRRPDRGGRHLADRRAASAGSPTDRPSRRSWRRRPSRPCSLRSSSTASMLVDGGVVNNVPISRAIAAGATRIYVLAVRALALPPAAPQAAGRGRPHRVLRGHPRPLHPGAGHCCPPASRWSSSAAAASRARTTGTSPSSAELIQYGRAEVAAVLERYRGTVAPDPAVRLKLRPPCAARDGAGPCTATQTIRA